ncbi:Adenine specific DNA methyltransferase [Melioribacter roseus P3M-2]|uniref:site-specific DNA-methyltransferase (adenine-specific) n=1 Tax=Melioribacter roseus (strain DSM 23840 / JCM 17771 / VKM B-2668 / P3M-2) TaxID=1191523 RepID=I6ZY99_MELRP|nr:type ISP restriction/modification enzyme [Melioribacter roseus]AFN73993.1 Adenine specific DNA methyltransferase [Melioribacter roseus P3M-2]
MKSLIEEYLKNLTKSLDKGDAREESYYKHLENLIIEFATLKEIKNVDVTILPKKTEAGNPDFRIWDGKNHITGYIEAKEPSVTNLDYIEDTEQLRRYLSTFPNVILTNFYEFRLYRDGERIKQAMIGRPVIAKKLKTAPPVEQVKDFEELLELFFSYSLPKVQSAQTLAVELAKRTRFLRDEIISLEMEESGAEKGKKEQNKIAGFYEAFKKYLIASLTEKQFADLYAQTITYGLFAARTRASDEFNRKLAFDYIPHTIGILRDVFRFISLEDPPKSLEIIVDDISEILNVADVYKILREYHGKGKDPLIHFYETFLATYDPEVRERRGVYYTPEPVVNYIVRAIHSILKSRFQLNDGLASEEVKLLDPAGGTLTFPAEAIKLAAEEFKSKYGKGGLHAWIQKHILSNYHAFELMMAPYAIGHLKIGLIFEELGYKMKDDERFKLYLTNTLEMEEISQTEIPGISSLSEESHLAGKIKKEQPVLVILGNPPYSGISSNINEWTERLLKEDINGAQSYYKVDGQPLGEKKLWLQDDYVKFLRFAQWKIQTSGHGIVGMITNHSYLDNPTFRGMRQSLMKTFDEIYILDLHGNSLKKETAPDGGKDENVFDIRQGVAIALFIKNKKPGKTKVFHADLYGLREKKYDWLDNNDFKKENYNEIKPVSPWYFFIPRYTSHIQEYLEWKRIDEIFPVNVTGIVTARDNLAIDFEKHSLKNKIMMFRNKDLPDEIVKEALKLKDNYQWKLSEQRKLFQKNNDWEKYFTKILYRPFDIRYIYYQDNIVFRTRPEVMRHMLEENIGLLTCRQLSSNKWFHALISKNIIDDSLISNRTKERTYVYPLYLYPDKEKNDLFSHHHVERKPNISDDIFNLLKSAYKRKPSPEEIIYYVYAVFYSNIYRETYSEFLKVDFPRVPFTTEYKLFKSMSKLGNELADLHLLKSKTLDKPIAKYQGSGSNDKIEKVIYKEEEQRIYINDEKYFEGVDPEVWNYQIGGYQVLSKYLKDRKGRIMDDAPRYCRIVTALSRTIKLQKEIDEIYTDIEKKEKII